MDTKALIQSQYHATLDMLEEAIRACPEDLWTDPGFKNTFWHVAYHAIFYTHLFSIIAITFWMFLFNNYICRLQLYIFVF